MAYAFRNQFAAQQHQQQQPQMPPQAAPPYNPLHSHTGPTLSEQQRFSQVPKSATDSSLETTYQRQSMLQGSPQHGNANPAGQRNVGSPSHNPNPLFSTPAHQFPSGGGGGVRGQGNRRSSPQRVASQQAHAQQGRPASQFQRGQSLLSPPPMSPVPLPFPGSSGGGGGPLNFSRTSAGTYYIYTLQCRPYRLPVVGWIIG